MLSHGKAGIDPGRWAYATLPKPLDPDGLDFTTAGPWSLLWSLEVRVTPCVWRQDRRRSEPNSTRFRACTHERTVAPDLNSRCPLRCSKRTPITSLAMSEMCHERTSPPAGFARSPETIAAASLSHLWFLLS